MVCSIVFSTLIRSYAVSSRASCSTCNSNSLKATFVSTDFCSCRGGRNKYLTPTPSVSILSLSSLPPSRRWLLPIAVADSRHFVVDFLFQRELSGARPVPQRIASFVETRYRWQRTLFAHRGPVYSCVFDHSGYYLFSASDDSMLKMWRVRDALLVRSFKAHVGAISDISVVRLSIFTAPMN